MINRSQLTTQKNIRFKTIILKSNFCDYNDKYILVKGTITVVGEGTDAAAIAVDRQNKQVIFKI